MHQSNGANIRVPLSLWPPRALAMPHSPRSVLALSECRAAHRSIAVDPYRAHRRPRPARGRVSRARELLPEAVRLSRELMPYSCNQSSWSS